MSGEASPWAVPLSDLRVDDELLDAARDAVASGWWSMGPRVGEFEQAFADASGSRHALAVANGTAALHVALLAVGCGPGDEVVLPSLNFVAAANTVVRSGATPVFCDVVGEGDLNLDPGDLEAAMGPACKAVIVLHYAGYPCDMDAVLELAARRGVAVIEDAAHAPGALIGDRWCGTVGAVGCFSFFSNKNIPIGEGGIVVTDDDDLAASMRLLRSHGMTTLTWDRHRGHAGSYDVVEAGFNYRLDEVRAAVALVQLRRLGANAAARRSLAARYRERLDGVEGIVIPFGGADAHERSAHHLVVAVLPADVSRDAVRERLSSERVQTSVHYPPIHEFTLYAGAPTGRRLPKTEEIARRLVTLPLYPHLEETAVDRVSELLVDAVRAERAGT